MRLVCPWRASLVCVDSAVARSWGGAGGRLGAARAPTPARVLIGGGEGASQANGVQPNVVTYTTLVDAAAQVPPPPSY